MLRRAYIFLAVTGIFALFLLPASSAYARTETGRVSVLSTNAALTTNHLPRKANPWLAPSLQGNAQSPISASKNSLWQRARSLPKWSCLSQPITTSLKSCSPTKLRSTFKLNPASKLSLKLSTGSQALTNRSSVGDLFTASNDFSTLNTEPAERRVLFAVHSLQADNVTMQRWQVQVTILGAAACAVVSALLQGAPRWILVSVAALLVAWAVFLVIKRPTYEMHPAPARSEATQPQKIEAEVKDRELPARLPPATENKPLTLPEIRPRIVAVSYSRIASVPALGFVVANDGEPAYEVSIANVQLGTSVVTFEGICPRMDNRSSTEWRVLIKHDHGGFSTGNSLRDEMRRQGVGEIAVPIRYKDGNGLWYVSHCRIELNASVINGITVRNDGQELISGKQPQGSATLPLTAPRPYLEVEDPIDERHGKTLFHFTNSGGDVAHNIQVQPLTINHLSVIFDPISDIAVNKTKTTIPTIPGIGIAGGHDILNLMEKEWGEAWEQRRLASQPRVDEWKTGITVTYEDFAEKRFEMTCDLVVFPLNRELRNRQALTRLGEHYKTVEVRNIKFRPI
jgi:hypothetical protein